MNKTKKFLCGLSAVLFAGAVVALIGAFVIFESCGKVFPNSLKGGGKYGRVSTNKKRD